MLENVRETRGTIRARLAVPVVDSYGETTDRLKWDTETARVPGRPRLIRGPSTVTDEQGRTLAKDEALLVVLTRWDIDEATTRIELGDDIWTITSRPVVRKALATGVHTTLRLKLAKVSAP